MRKHSSTHSDNISTLHYLKSASRENILLSASTDGLITLSDANEDDEDEAIIRVANWGCSISNAGWMINTAEPSIWATSDMETLSLWSYDVCV